VEERGKGEVEVGGYDVADVAVLRVTTLGQLPEDDRALTAVVTSRGDDGRTVGKWLGKVERGRCSVRRRKTGKR
jgi:hypothetical protein